MSGRDGARRLESTAAAVRRQLYYEAFLAWHPAYVACATSGPDGRRQRLPTGELRCWAGLLNAARHPQGRLRWWSRALYVTVPGQDPSISTSTASTNRSLRGLHNKQAWSPVALLAQTASGLLRILRSVVGGQRQSGPGGTCYYWAASAPVPLPHAPWTGQAWTVMSRCTGCCMLKFDPLWCAVPSPGAHVVTSRGATGDPRRDQQRHPQPGASHRPVGWVDCRAAPVSSLSVGARHLSRLHRHGCGRPHPCRPPPVSASELTWRSPPHLKVAHAGWRGGVVIPRP
jgi:hypothetical protein